MLLLWPLLAPDGSTIHQTHLVVGQGVVRQMIVVLKTNQPVLALCISKPLMSILMRMLSVISVNNWYEMNLNIGQCGPPANKGKASVLKVSAKKANLKIC